jgi:putative mRNA 3-end processing factor
MRPPIDVAMSGAVILSGKVCCDGFLHVASVRVQTHVHMDHLDGFESSKGFQTIVTSEGTMALLCCEFDADLPYRSNIISLPSDGSVNIGDAKITLASSGHMLGCVQVKVETSDGLRLGYSGDFQWPCDEVIEVDELVVDSTYGSPESVRNYSQDECEYKLLQLVKQRLPRGPIHIYAHRGTMQRALQLLTGEIDAPIIASNRLAKEVEIYRRFGYPIGKLVDATTIAGREIGKTQRYVKLYGTGDSKPADVRGTTIKLTAYFSRPDEPMTEYSERSYGIALSNHADFKGTLEYVQATGARRVVTDNTRGKGVELAAEIRRRLGIEAVPSSNFDSREWGV